MVAEATPVESGHEREHMERIRTIEVTVVIDTNKRTITEAYAPREDETTEEFTQRVATEIVELTEVA